MVAITEEYERGGASTNTGAWSARSRRGRGTDMRVSPLPVRPWRRGASVHLRPQHRAARAVGVDHLGQRIEIVGDVFVAQLDQPLLHPLAEGVHALVTPATFGVNH